MLREGWVGVGDNNIWNQGKCQKGNKMKGGETKRTCLMNKMNSGSQENDLLMVSAKVDILTTVFDEHDSYYSLPSTSLQHCYCVPPLCNFKHFFLIPVHMKIHMHICAYEHTSKIHHLSPHQNIFGWKKKKKKEKRNEKTFWERSAWNCGKLVILEENDQEEHWEDLFQCWRPCHWNFFF